MPRQPSKAGGSSFSILPCSILIGNLPLSEANGMVGVVVWPQLVVHSEGEQHSGPSLLPDVGWSGDEEHRWQARWCPLYRQHEGQYAQEPLCHPLDTPSSCSCNYYKWDLREFQLHKWPHLYHLSPEAEQGSQEDLPSLPVEIKICSVCIHVDTITEAPAYSEFTCLVAASERFLRVQRQFWTRRWLGSVRWSPKACIPPRILKKI